MKRTGGDDEPQITTGGLKIHLFRLRKSINGNNKPDSASKPKKSTSEKRNRKGRNKKSSDDVISDCSDDGVLLSE